MAVAGEGAVAAAEFEQRVLERVKAAEARGEPPLVCAMEVGRCVAESGMGIPCVELGEVIVSNLCFRRNTPAFWKLLDQAIASRLVSPIHVLALLTPRVIPSRQMQPEAYRLYLELLGRYTFSFSSMGSLSYNDKIIKSIDGSLQLSTTYGVHILEIGKIKVLFLFTIIINLMDSVLEDYGLHLDSIENKCAVSIVGNHDMAIDANAHSNDKISEHRQLLCRENALMAVKTMEKITQNKKAKVLLRLVHLNMPEKFNCLLQRLQFVEAQKSTSQTLIPASHELDKLSANIQQAMNRKLPLKHNLLVDSLISIGSCQLSSYPSSGAGPSVCWVPFDIVMENAMDGKHLYAASVIDVLAELTVTLQVINQASWQETFEALWIAALRLVQRSREPVVGPLPQLDARLCMLLSIIPLTIVNLLKEDKEPVPTNDDTPKGMTGYENCTEKNSCASRRHGLVSCLQLLGQFGNLLSPPQSVVSAANTAATKAAAFISGFKKGNSSFDSISYSGTPVRAVGNMLHLIVEACIARNLIDTSAYFWPGYVVMSPTPLSDSISVHESPWLAFMGGTPLSGSLKNSLMMTPATSLSQVEKVYHIALNGSDEERSAAAKILCGASLHEGWNIQEHVVHLVVKLLSPPAPPDFSGPGSHMFGYLSMLNSLLFGASCIDVVHIISLFGMVPEVAAALMPLCEAFGSVPPSPNSKAGSDETSVYSVFSCAFLFLLRLWKFYRPPHEHSIGGRWGNVRPELTLDYILLMHNRSVASQNFAAEGSNQATESLGSVSVYIGLFPKLRAWYMQNAACVASTLSGVGSANPVHQLANKILNMICQKMSKVVPVSGNPSSTSTSSISGSSTNTGEDSYQKPLLPAWDILEAVPFVLEAVLTACANGKLSSRELTTGLRDLVDFLPASLAIIISYFSAEISRGIWKPVQMNGTDWPSPAANLASIESEIKDILASAGVHVASCYAEGATPVMLPLPMAALLSLTLTFKLDKKLEYIHAVAGPALENCATGYYWSSMPIMGALWAQKVRRWHDYIVLSCARTPFTQDRDATTQLLRSCFTAFLGPSAASGSHLTARRGVNGLLGCAFADQGARLPVAPGFLYIRSCKTFFDTRFLSHELLKLVIRLAHDSAAGWTCGGPVRLQSSLTSLTSATTRVKEIAALGASLLCIAGGVRLVQVLYMETAPTWLLSQCESKENVIAPASFILEGYAMAYMMILSGSFVWGSGDHAAGFILSGRSRRGRAVSIHMDFLAGAMEGNISLGCDPVTWKAYVSCLLGLMVRFTPAWVSQVKLETLRKLANGLRGWHECELALSLLESGGPAAMGLVAEAIL